MERSQHQEYKLALARSHKTQTTRSTLVDLALFDLINYLNLQLVSNFESLSHPECCASTDESSYDREWFGNRCTAE
jgi:hypothetical protein